MLQRATGAAGDGSGGRESAIEVKIRRAALLAAIAGVALATEPPRFDSARYLDDIKFLASPEMRGRADGSPELEKAAKYIEEQFRADGLKPVDSSYLQPFEITASAKLGRNNKLEATWNGELESLQPDKDFVPSNFSGSAKASGAAVFAGYGITAPEYDYDDYAGLDVRGKFVIVLAHEPQEFDAKSIFEGKVYTDHSEIYSKAETARQHGARGVILVLDRVNHKNAKDEIDPFGGESGPADAGIPFVQMREAVVNEWVRDAGHDLLATEEAIDKDLKPRSFALPGMEIREDVEVERAVRTVHNVIAYLPGETPEYVIVGAHYDHLGLGGQYSMAPLLTGRVHPGADDNASGTAGVIELARYFSRVYRGQKPKRGLLFMAYAGEELGLLGSGYYANHPLLPLDDAVAMLNMDMIGRVREGKLYIGGAATGTSFRADLDELVAKTDFRVDYSESGYGSSDHTSFTARQVPVLFFFSGLHGDYHRPSDTWDKIDAPAAVNVLKLVSGMVGKLETENDRPVFVRVKSDEAVIGGAVHGLKSRDGVPGADEGVRPSN
ncbi:MAG TPA: M28 family peptidase [Bryobacteraceae bacterium]|nr:M28 family peptidase [Bryobacteraceae bacterium]